MGCAGALRKEEGWIDGDVHRLPPAEPGHSEEQISSPADRRAFRPASGYLALFEDRLEIGIPSAASQRAGRAEDSVSYTLWALRVLSDAVRIDECASSVHSSDE
eukprot:TRINITY_DN15236_c0_g1_i6.p1 TRINITY_DN15236_c0_g1~~TRINITY_DN15236_c0_g1_i6.p1  ORF type:complete len:118 (-),score=11.94 TRINITY_DN15236_c0_g1_i6:277-588(-)